jgi:hypothetical protein
MQQQIIKNFNLLKLFIIVSVIIGGLLYINRTKNNNENFAITNPIISTIPNTTIMNIIPSISNAINSGYNNINKNRFDILDNQIRLNQLNTRVNKLLENIQKTYNITNKPSVNPIKFY